MVDMVDTEATVVWDTDPMVDMVWDTDPMVDTLASVRLKLSPRLMLIPTTMVDMDLEDMEDMVDMVDTEATVVWDTDPMVDMVWDTDPMVDTLASVRLKLSP